MSTFSVQGMAALEARLKNLSTDVATKIGQSANRAGTVYLAKKVREALPVGPDAEGSTRKRKRKGGSVVTEKHRKISNSVKVKKTKNSNVNTVENAISITAYQIAFVEFGSIHNAPGHIVKDTFDREQQAATEQVVKILGKRITKAGA